MTLTGGIFGKQVGGQRFPRYTLRLTGRYTVTFDHLRWVLLAPWRSPSLVEVPWSTVHMIRPDGSVKVDGCARVTTLTRVEST